MIMKGPPMTSIARRKAAALTLGAAWATGALLYGCASDGSNSGLPSGSTTTGPTSTSTAGGGEGGAPMDGSSQEDGAAAEAGDNSANEVTVIIAPGGLPSVAKLVYFTEVGGSVVAVATDANGKAAHVMQAGGHVTVPECSADPTEHQTLSIMGVAPGDKMRLPCAPPPSAAVKIGHISGTITPPDGVPTPQYSFESCPYINPTSTPSYDSDITPGCLDDKGNLNFIIYATGGGGA